MNYYIKNQEYYYDIWTLKILSGYSTLKLKYFLDKEKITKVSFCNDWLYKLEDLQKSEFFRDIIQPNVVVIDDDLITIL